MNVDLAIHHLAFREADTLGVAQLLVARRQNELSLELLRLRADAPEAQSLTLVDKALTALTETVEQAAPDAVAHQPTEHHLVDKKA